MCNFSFCFSSQCNAQRGYYHGKIYLTDGKVLVGYTQIPSRLYDNAINYKPSKESNPISIFSTAIDSLEYETSIDTSKFIYTTCDIYKMKSGEVKTKKRKRWLVQTWKTKQMNVYAAADKYNIDKNGVVIINGTYSIEFYVKKINALNCFLVYSYKGQSKLSKYFNASLSYYCSDTPRLVKKIRNNEYTWEKIYEVAETYNWCKLNAKKKQSSVKKI